uniref:Uncharacterized protein n=1 Tax=Globodera pallida TaxID=36090 RepID=A0A183C5J7_GLOPA
MSFNFVVVVLLALVVAGCAAENVLRLKLKPCLTGNYAYRVSVHCANRTVTDGQNPNLQSTELMQQNAYYKYDVIDLNSLNCQVIKLKFGEEKCPEQRYHLYVRIINTKYIDFSIWPNDFVKTLTMTQGLNIHQLTFGNFFKIAILPKLEENSKMFYRLNVFCESAAAGGSDRHRPAEFKTFTKFDTLVVFNMEQRKCEQYSVNVWPVHQDWMDRHEMFNQPALIRDVAVANGATQAIYFQSEFKLAISPPLAPNSGKVNSVYNFMYLPNSADKKLKRLPSHHMDDDAVNPMVTTKQQKLGQTSADNINENQQQQQKLAQTLTNFQSEIAEATRQQNELSNKLDALQTQIAQIKQNDATKLEQSLTNFQNELEEIKQREAEKWKKMTTLINILLNEVAEIKQLEQKKLMQLPAQLDEFQNEMNSKFGQLSINKDEIRQEIAATKQENMEKFEQISTHLGCLRTEIAGIKQKEDDKLGGQMSANIEQLMHEFKQIKNEHGEIKRDLSEIRTTIFEIKEFLESI